MAEYKLVMPKMGESVFEATILTWLKKPGDKVAQDETVLEVATDKVDSDVPSPVEGVVKQLFFDEGDTVEVGKVLAIIDTDQDFDQPDIAIEEEQGESTQDTEPEIEQEEVASPVEEVEKTVVQAKEAVKPIINQQNQSSSKYFSPLVLNIAQTEGISLGELDKINGSGKEGRVTKEDILDYLKNRGKVTSTAKKETASPAPEAKSPTPPSTPKTPISIGRNDEVIEMDRMRKLIANHMVNSINTSAHVSSFVEADLTNVVLWRNKHKNAFEKREGFKLSFMPIFVEAITHAIMEFPMINVSVDGDKIIRKVNINVGVATALPSGNLIVPVIKNADQKSLVGIAREMNDIVVRARQNQLRPDDTQGGTYTISNIGTFGNIIGTPIINQPQVAIMAVGSITKKPAVLETAQGDVIAIRHKMYLSHTYDHRVVDGMLGGMFVKYVGDYLEKWDMNREV
ncbi:MAG: dihydrolipoamide acetyltransferase family protein [Chitinophagales bacterium]